MARATYHGSCQCGAVAFEADLDLDRTVVCNCSRCRRLGSTPAYAPRDRFRLLSGEAELTAYRFNAQTIEHLFRRTCGIEAFACGATPDGAPMAAVNANCLDGVDARALKSTAYDGAAA
jgi:hypothetical protein